MIGFGKVPSIEGWLGSHSCHEPSGGPPRLGATPSSKRSITGWWGFAITAIGGIGGAVALLAVFWRPPRKEPAAT